MRRHAVNQTENNTSCLLAYQTVKDGRPARGPIRVDHRRTWFGGESTLLTSRSTKRQNSENHSSQKLHRHVRHKNTLLSAPRPLKRSPLPRVSHLPTQSFGIPYTSRRHKLPTTTPVPQSHSCGRHGRIRTGPRLRPHSLRVSQAKAINTGKVSLRSQAHARKGSPWVVRDGSSCWACCFTDAAAAAAGDPTGRGSPVGGHGPWSSACHKAEMAQEKMLEAQR
jgi:hypothetical protein